jgi:hypothetical protein
MPSLFDRTTPALQWDHLSFSYWQENVGRGLLVVKLSRNAQTADVPSSAVPNEPSAAPPRYRLDSARALRKQLPILALNALRNKEIPIWG